MSLVTRSTLPEDFFDTTSAELLVQPRPQYIYAQLFKMGLNASLGEGETMAQAGARSVGAGGAMSDPVESMRLAMEDPNFSGAIKVIPELGKRPGHTVRMNRPVFTSTTYTQASRQLSSGTTLSTTPISIAMEQVAVTLKEWGGPYSAAQSAVAPIGLERFDGKLSIHSSASLAKEQLKEDHDHFIHAVMNALLENASSVVRSSNFTADAQFVSQDAAPMDLETIMKTETALRTANIPTFPNGRYCMVADPNQVMDLALDPLFAKYAEDHAPINPVLSQSYFKTVNGIDIFRSNVLTTDSSTVSGVNIYHAQAFGPGCLGAGLGSLPRVEVSSNNDYGRQALLVWLMDAGWELLDNRFVVNVRTT